MYIHNYNKPVLSCMYCLLSLRLSLCMSRSDDLFIDFSYYYRRVWDSVQSSSSEGCTTLCYYICSSQDAERNYGIYKNVRVISTLPGLAQLQK